MGTATNQLNANLKRGDGVGLIYNSLVGRLKFMWTAPKRKPCIEFILGAVFNELIRPHKNYICIIHCECYSSVYVLLATPQGLMYEIKLLSHYFLKN